MMPEHPTLPTACTQAFEALERDPLQLPALVEAHLEHRDMAFLQKLARGILALAPDKAMCAINPKRARNRS